VEGLFAPAPAGAGAKSTKLTSSSLRRAWRLSSLLSSLPLQQLSLPLCSPLSEDLYDVIPLCMKRATKRLRPYPEVHRFSMRTPHPSGPWAIWGH